MNSPQKSPCTSTQRRFLSVRRILQFLLRSTVFLHSRISRRRLHSLLLTRFRSSRNQTHRTRAFRKIATNSQKGHFAVKRQRLGAKMCWSNFLGWTPTQPSICNACELAKARRRALRHSCASQCTGRIVSGNPASYGFIVQAKAAHLPQPVFYRAVTKPRQSW